MARRADTDLLDLAREGRHSGHRHERSFHLVASNRNSHWQVLVDEQCPQIVVKGTVKVTGVSTGTGW